jgi:hypothetical protein
MILMAGHRGRREPSNRLVALRAEEDAARANERATYEAFSERIKTMKRENLAYLEEAKAAGKTVYGFGAPVKGNTLLNYCGIGTDYLDVLVEKNPLRQGLYSPGMHIPVILEQDVHEPPDVYFVLAWNFKKEILANNQDLIRRGVNFYFPVEPMED